MNESVKIETLVPLPPLQRYFQSFITEDILKQLDPAIEKQLPPQEGMISNQSGFACFIYGGFFELGLGSREPNYQKAFNHYHQGATVFLDPLCAYRLAEMYSSTKATQFLQQPSKLKAFGFYLLSTLTEFHYSDFKVPLISIDETASRELFIDKFIREIDQSSNLVVYGELIFDQAVYILSKQPTYSKLIEAFQKPYPQLPIFIIQTFLVLIFPDKTDNKQVEALINLLTDNCAACLSQLGTHREHSNFELQLPIVFNMMLITLKFNTDERQRELLFELTFFVKNIIQIKKRNNMSEETLGQLQIWEPLSKCFEECQKDLNKLIHQALVLRTLAKIQIKGLGGRGQGSIQNAKKLLLRDMELPRDQASNSQGLSYFKMAKLCLKDKDSLNYKIHLYKAKSLFEARIQVTTINRYEKLVCTYYLSRIANLENDAQQEMVYLEQTQFEPALLQRVRTLQFHILIKKALSAKVRLSEQKQVFSEYEHVSVQQQHHSQQEEIILSQQSNKLQEVSKGSQASEQEDQQKLIFAYRLKRNQLATVDLEKKQIVMNIDYRQSKYKDKDQKDAGGPMVISIFQKQNQSQRDQLFEDKKDSLPTINADLSRRVFLAKGLSSSFYMVYLGEKRYSLKVLTEKKQLQNDHLIKMRQIQHPKLRRILGVSTDSYLSLVYEYYENNLYSFSRNEIHSFNDRKVVALDIIEGLMFLHSKQIILKNLKPSNILIQNKRAILSDWELPVRSNIQGYRAPEETLYYASDTFSLAWVLVLLFLQIDVGSHKQFNGISGSAQVPGLANQELTRVNLKSIQYLKNCNYQGCQENKKLVDGFEQMMKLEFEKRLALPELQKLIQEMK